MRQVTKTQKDFGAGFLNSSLFTFSQIQISLISQKALNSLFIKTALNPSNYVKTKEIAGINTPLQNIQPVKEQT